MDQAVKLFEELLKIERENIVEEKRKALNNNRFILFLI